MNFPTYETQFDQYLNSYDSLLNQRYEPNESVVALAGGVATNEIQPEQISKTLATSLLPAGKLSFELRGWTHTMTFSATDSDTVAWSTGTLTLGDKITQFSISAGNTGNISALTYIYFDIYASKTALQTTTTAINAIGIGKILIAVAQNSTSPKDAIFQVFGGAGGNGILVTADNIAANTITANEILANTFTGAEMAATIKITAGTGDNVGVLDGSDATYRIYAGDSTPADAPFSVTQSGIMTAVGGKYVENFTAGETIAAGNVVCFKKALLTSTTAISIDSYTDSNNVNTNYGTSEEIRVGVGGAPEQTCNAFFGFNVADSKPDKVILRFWGNVGTIGTLRAFRVTEAWGETTITHANMPVVGDGCTAGDATGDPGTVITGTGWQWVDVDVTNTVRGQMSTFWDETQGVRLQFDGNVGYIGTLRSSETTDTGHEPRLLITKGIDLEGDGKVYVASNADINIANQIIGIAITGGSLDETIKVQYHGIVTGLSGLTTGRKYYLSTAGGLFLPDATGTNFQLDFNKTLIGTALSTTTLFLGIENEKFLWKSEPIHTIATNGLGYVFSPLDSNECIIQFEKWDDATGTNKTPAQTVILKRNGPNNTVYAGLIHDTAMVQYTWDDTNNKITITNTSIGASPNNSVSTFYFYK